MTLQIWIKYGLWRFIYIRYAAEVIKEGLTLLHLLTLIFITVFCVHITMIYPVRLAKKYALQNIIFMNTFLRYLSNGKAYQDSIKGLLCSMTNITNVIQDEDLKLKISRKPILLNLGLVFVFMGLHNFYLYSALKQRFLFGTFIKIDICKNVV